MNLSNRFLALLVIVSMVFSMSFSFLIFNKLTGITRIQPSARVTEVGKINLSVQSSISILLTNAIVDFGEGFVNTSCDAINLNGKNYANLTAGQTYNDDGDCWTGTTTPTSFVVENNGNVNVSVQVAGPSPLQFFNYSGTYDYNLTVKPRNNEANSCAGSLYSNWVQLNENATMCNRLKYYPDDSDTIAIDVNILIPIDLPAGKYENSTIEFYATQV